MYNGVVVVVVNKMKPFTHASPRYGELRRGSSKWLFCYRDSRQGASAKWSAWTEPNKHRTRYTREQKATSVD